VLERFTRSASDQDGDTRTTRARVAVQSARSCDVGRGSGRDTRKSARARIARLNERGTYRTPYALLVHTAGIHTVVTLRPNTHGTRRYGRTHPYVAAISIPARFADLRNKLMRCGTRPTETARSSSFRKQPRKPGSRDQGCGVRLRVMERGSRAASAPRARRIDPYVKVRVHQH
jgi:hypothetical protein